MTERLRIEIAERNSRARAAWRARLNSGQAFPDAYTPRQRSALEHLLLARRMHAVRWLHEKRSERRRAEALAACINRAERVHKLRLVRNARV